MSAESRFAMAEVWLYGSTARGDADELSDIDILIACDEQVDLEALGLRRAVSASAYSWAEIEHMVTYGSLFLHHVRLEGRPLFEQEPPRLRSLLEMLPPYRRVHQELESFSRVVDDVTESARHDHSPAFELAVLATAARHSAILGCYLVGAPQFGRRRPFEELLPRLGYSDAVVRDFERLYDYRIRENRFEASEESADSVEAWASRVRELVIKVKELDDEQQHQSGRRLRQSGTRSR